MFLSSMLVLVLIVLLAAVILSYTIREVELFSKKEPDAAETDLNTFGVLKQDSQIGVVTRIDTTWAMVDASVVRPGDRIYGALVLDIKPDSVAFARKGQIWSQRPGQSPNPAWTY